MRLVWSLVFSNWLIKVEMELFGSFSLVKVTSSMRREILFFCRIAVECKLGASA